MKGMKGQKLRDYSYTCVVDGMNGDYFRRGREGSHNSRVLRVDLATGIILENLGKKVPNHKIKNLRKYEEVLAEMAVPAIPRLPADRNARIDSQVEEHIKRQARSTAESFNEVLRRLLGLDPA